MAKVMEKTQASQDGLTTQEILDRRAKHLLPSTVAYYRQPIVWTTAIEIMMRLMWIKHGSWPAPAL